MMNLIKLADTELKVEGPALHPQAANDCTCGECNTAGETKLVPRRELKVEELEELLRQVSKKYYILVGGLLASVALLTLGIYVTFGWGPALAVFSGYTFLFCRKNVPLLRVARLQIKSYISMYKQGETAGDENEVIKAVKEATNPSGYL